MLPVFRVLGIIWALSFVPWPGAKQDLDDKQAFEDNKTRRACELWLQADEAKARADATGERGEDGRATREAGSGQDGTGQDRLHLRRSLKTPARRRPPGAHE